MIDQEEFVKGLDAAEREEVTPVYPAPLTLGWQEHPFQDRAAIVDAILWRWRGTPYRVNRCREQSGVDCVRFVVAVLEELYRGEFGEMDKVPHDISFHDPEGARASMRNLIRQLRERMGCWAEDVTAGLTVQAGDVVVVGPEHGGPGHLMIVGMGKRIFHSVWNAEVCPTGLTLRYPLHRIFRPAEQERWGGGSAA